jgi:hypothetical protein
VTIREKLTLLRDAMVRLGVKPESDLPYGAIRPDDCDRLLLALDVLEAHEWLDAHQSTVLRAAKGKPWIVTDDSTARPYSEYRAATLPEAVSQLRAKIEGEKG